VTATSSIYPSVKAQLVTVLGTALDPVPVTYAWTGSDTQPKAVFLGRHPDVVGANALLAAAMPIESDVPTITGGRKQRNEEFTLPVTVWSFRPDLTPADAQIAEADGFEMQAAIDGVLADDPKIGLSTIQWAVLAATDVHGDGGPVPFQSGWASILTLHIAVKARLT
jgi:hypothetical protein